MRRCENEEVCLYVKDSLLVTTGLFLLSHPTMIRNGRTALAHVVAPRRLGLVAVNR